MGSGAVDELSGAVEDSGVTDTHPLYGFIHSQFCRRELAVGISTKQVSVDSDENRGGETTNRIFKALSSFAASMSIASSAW